MSIEIVIISQLNLYILLRFVIMSSQRLHSQYGRGKGSFKEGYDKSKTPEKQGQKSSFRAKKNINFDPK